MNPFATHIPALLACLERTSGPVLELGSGWFSTPIVSAFATDRLVRTIETNPEWYSRVSGLGVYQPITRHRHQFVFVPDYNDAQILDHQWDVVILDHEPPPRRGHDALVLRDRCRFMIGHDSEHPDYRYGEAFDQFNHRFTDSRRLPWTTVVSDEPLDWLAGRRTSVPRRPRMKLAALCCTFRRPHTLGQLVESFLRQDYPAELRELVILDDAGQYENQSGDGWLLVSIPSRFRTLGEKRNACAALASADVEGFLVADDDDIYLPHWFSAQAEALKQADWSRPGLVLLEDGDALREAESEGLYHGGWAFRKETFYRVRGYGPHNNGEDQELAGRLNEAGAKCCDPCSFAKPFYVYRYDNNSYHLSYMDDAGYRSLGDGAVSKSQVQQGWFRDFSSMPVRRRFVFAPHANTGSDQQRIELIGPVDGPGGDGPSNGMYALQKELRKRIDLGLDWLTIKSLPASREAIPWFWNWADRRYAAWWDEQGLPFVQGPNMLFVNSGTPRVDAERCALLDAANCRAMFCHTQWYRDLIAKHRGPANQSEIILWPYPIDPWPGEPLPDEYDLLIYAKNGHRPQLLEHLAEVFPRHIQIHYGRYRREELFEAARRSRACAYLADDDHGPLALQEILLAGCPTVGVRTGASFVRTGETGVVVDRLPPGRQCAESDEDVRAFAVFMEAIKEAQSMDRHSVRDYRALAKKLLGASLRYDEQQLKAIYAPEVKLLPGNRLFQYGLELPGKMTPFGVVVDREQMLPAVKKQADRDPIPSALVPGFVSLFRVDQLDVPAGEFVTEPNQPGESVFDKLRFSIQKNDVLLKVSVPNAFRYLQIRKTGDEWKVVAEY